MRLPKKFVIVVLGAVSTLSAVCLAQTQGSAPRLSGQTLVIEEASVDWILKSDVSAMADGVVEKIELEIGKLADREGAVIGYLHKRKAEILVAKAELAANNKGAIRKAKAQVDLAASVVNRNINLTRKDPYAVAKEEQEKAIAEASMAKAMEVEATENVALAAAELALAKQQLEEHTIRAPFPGVVFERLKNPGESVRTGDPIVRIGNLDKLRVFAYIPLDYAKRVKVGSLVEIRPRISGPRSDGSNVDSKTYRGEVTFVDPQIQPVSETAVRIYADFANPNHELSPGLKVSMTIQLEPAGNVATTSIPAPAGSPAGSTLPELPPSAKTVGASNGGVELPQLPR